MGLGSPSNIYWTSPHTQNYNKTLILTWAQSFRNMLPKCFSLVFNIYAEVIWTIIEMKSISILNNCIEDSTVQPELRITGQIHRVSALATYGIICKAWIIDALILTPDVLLNATWSLGHLIDSGDFNIQLRFWGFPQSNIYELITNMNSLYYLEGWGNKQ